ncbi:MAG: hypothetical protein WCH31_05270 [Actinomycetes bacterium]
MSSDRPTTRPLQNPALHRGGGFEECEHIVRDEDPDTALCGVDQTGVPWNQGFPVCQACLAVAEGRMS